MTSSEGEADIGGSPPQQKKKGAPFNDITVTARTTKNTSIYTTGSDATKTSSP
jgi:hypothetical protein